MDDFPIWMKLLIWLIIGGTIAYAGGMSIYSAMPSSSRAQAEHSAPGEKASRSAP